MKACPKCGKFHLVVTDERLEELEVDVAEGLDKLFNDHKLSVVEGIYVLENMLEYARTVARAGTATKH